jgi:hypothetical protein
MIQSGRPSRELLSEDERFVYRLVDPVKEGNSLWRFYCESFGRDFSFTEFEWFKVRHPLGPSRVYVAQEKSTGRFAASMGMQKFLYRFNGVVQDLSLAISAVTHPDFRRLRLFVQVNSLVPQREREEGIRFGITFPNAAAFPGHIKAGWEAPFELRFLEKKSFENRGSSAAAIASFDEGFDEFYQAAGENFDLISVKDHRILNWRYFQRPGVRYECFAVRKTTIEGFIVLKKFSGGLEEKSHIVDFLAVTDRAAQELISKAEQFAEGTSVLNLWMMPGSRYEALFESRGFEASGESQPVILRPHGGGEIPAVSAPWLVLGDNDVY